MKKSIILSVLIFILSINVGFSQENVPCTIQLKQGEIIEVHHFGYLTCGGVKSRNQYEDIIKVHGFYGEYNEQEVNLTNYDNVKRLEFREFYRKPKYASGGKKRHEKGYIKVINKDGFHYPLHFAYPIHSCSGGHYDGSNEIRVQIKEGKKIEEKYIAVREIRYIIF